MNDEFYVDIGKRILDARFRKKYSRDELAERAGISPSFLGLLETGKKGMSARTLCSLAKVLNVTADYLLFGVEDAEQYVDYAAQTLASLPVNERESVRVLLETAIELVRKMEQIGE